jgi:PAS domain S-box-containing protein/putative nucleotidyltransferase with HDIG domain
MKTNKDSTGKKDWQKADARVLGQILAAQNIDFVLPDITHIAEFFAETLNTIPGIASCRVCLEGVTVQRGEMDSGICEECLASRQRAAEQGEIAPFLPGFDFKCGLGEQPGMYLHAVASLSHHFGFFIFQVSDLDVFNIYRPFIDNLANYVAISLENRWQRDLLQQAHDELELKVEERTQDLVVINKHLQDEIKIRRQTENALRESEQQITQLINNSPIAMLVSTGIEEHVEWANDKFIELFGYTVEDMPDVAHWWPLAYPDEKYREEVKTQWQARVEQAIRDNDQIEPMEATVRCKDGSYRHIEFRLSSIGQKKLITFVDLTERKRVEQALRESETEFRAVFESSVDAIGVSKVGIHTFVNPAYLALFGCTDNTELNGKSILDLIAPSHREQILENVRHRASGQAAPIAYETRGLRKDGSEFDMDVHTSTYELSGEIYSIAILRDITERKRAEKQLLASEQLFRALVENSPDFIARYDLEYRRIYVNPAIQKLFANSAENVLGKTPTEQSPIYAPPLYIKHLQQAIKNASESTLETPYRTAQGEMHWGQIRFVPEFGSDGKVTSVLAIGRDIHDIKENERHFRMLAENFPDFVMRFSRDGRYAYVNPAFEKAFDIPAEAVVGKTLYELPRHSNPEQNDALLALIQRTFDEDTSNELEVHWDTDMGKRIFEIRQAPEKDATGNVINVLSIARDITERKQMVQELAAKEREFRTLAENSPDNIARYDANCRTLYVNPTLEKTLGRPVSEMLGTTPMEAALIDEARKYQETIAEVFETGKDDEMDIVLPDGEEGVRYHNIRFVAERGADGAITGVQTIGRDITERIHIENALRENEQKFRSFVEESSEGFTLLDEQGRVIEWNRARERMTGLKADKVVGRFLWDVLHQMMPPERRTLEIYETNKKAILDALETGQSPILNRAIDAEVMRQDGERQFVQQTVFPIKTEKGYRIGSVTIDITERKQAQEALTLFRSLIDQVSDIIEVADPETGRILDANERACLAHSYTREEYLALTIPQINPVVAARSWKETMDELRRSGSLVRESQHRRKDGSTFPVEININYVRLDRDYVLSVVRDITERKKAEQALRESEERLRQIASSLREVIWLRDVQTRQVLYVNPAFEELTGRTCESFFENRDIVTDAIHPDDKEEVIKALEQRFAGVPYDKEHRIIHLDGSVRWVSSRIFPVRNEAGEVYRWASIMEDITERKQAEEALQESEDRYRRMVELSPDSISIHSQGRVVFVNSTTVRLSGAKEPEELLGRTVLELIHPDSRETAKQRIAQMLATSEPTPFVEEKLLRVDGSAIDVEVAAVPFRYRGAPAVQIVARDITERKQHEREREAIITVSTALRQARTRTEILDVILDQLVDLFDADGAVLVLPDPKTEGCINEMGSGVVGERMIGLNIPPGKGVCDWAITNKKAYLNNHADDDPLFYRSDLLGDSHCVVAAPLATQELIIGALWVARQVDFVEQDLRLLTAIADIAANAVHRVTLHEQTEQQLHRLIALHQIDLAISTNFDLNITLNVILESVKDELEVDAASILLLNPVTHTLNYAAGIGFRTHNIEGSRVKLGNGCAGRAAQEQRTVSSLELGQARETLSRFSFLSGEDFTSHYATPLVVKGQVKGVLEIFHRAAIEPEHTWLGYFETLATQAAIAIDNASLFENLQRSNMELTLAYDATIEGWSRALDLRDRETEGHTQRVTEMALELAEKMGMSDAEKMDLRRGALLHDIGKMGIPDEILLKPSPLSDEEWKIMRQHPLYAYQMLAPISYLKRALEIPYCHHEKWDGSGYPRGLKGEEIPLSARVFSVVDVFDALISDRPYSKPWPREQAYRYVQEQAGKHFDPQIAKIFLETK